jgi:hypothetical protein
LRNRDVIVPDAPSALLHELVGIAPAGG